MTIYQVTNKTVSILFSTIELANEFMREHATATREHATATNGLETTNGLEIREIYVFGDKKCAECEKHAKQLFDIRNEILSNGLGYKSEIDELKIKLAKYESAEKFWVGTHGVVPDDVTKVLRKHRIDVDSLWSEHWQVAVIDKKKANEE